MSFICLTVQTGANINLFEITCLPYIVSHAVIMCESGECLLTQPETAMGHRTTTVRNIAGKQSVG